MSGPADAQYRVFASAEELATAAADWILDRGIQCRGRFTLCLSGGETPRRLYELLAAPERGRFPWNRTHVFWGDERFVPHDDPRSNFHMAWQAMLGHVPIPAENIHPIRTEQTNVESAAADYEATLKRFYGADILDSARPLFDLILLGLGEDGHIASLFPGSQALTEQKHWAVPVSGANALARISLTYPALSCSAAVGFLVVGDRKRAIFARARAGDPDLPASHLRSAGTVCWFADRAAASRPAFSGE
ncbi:MAG: 6-phosphogluconolactonase [Xanthobacteraceae bacterium]